MHLKNDECRCTECEYYELRGSKGSYLYEFCKRFNDAIPLWRKYTKAWCHSYKKKDAEAQGDVVKVVRCSKCIWHSNRTGMCNVWFKNTDNNGYCYRGERKHK